MLVAAGLLLGAGIAVLAFVSAVDQAPRNDITVLVGSLGASQISVLAGAACLAALAVGLCLIPVARPWLTVVIPARAVAIFAVSCALFLLMWSPWTTMTPLLDDQGCETGYIVVERSFLRSGTGAVYRIDGVVATRVGTSVPDDGYHPFADGNYAVTDDGDMLHIWYSPFSDKPVSTASREADIVAPRLAGGEPRCGTDNRTTPYQDRTDGPVTPQRDPEDEAGDPLLLDLP